MAEETDEAGLRAARADPRGRLPPVRRPGLPRHRRGRHLRRARRRQGRLLLVLPVEGRPVHGAAEDLLQRLRRAQHRPSRPPRTRSPASSRASGRRSVLPGGARLPRRHPDGRPLRRVRRRAPRGPGDGRRPTRPSTSSRACRPERIRHGDPELMAHGILGAIYPLRRDLPRGRTARSRPTVRNWPTRPWRSASAASWPSRGPRGSRKGRPSSSAFRIPRTAWRMRCSFSTRAKRTWPSPSTAETDPGDDRDLRLPAP